MKKITLVLVSLMLIAVSIFSQAPTTFKYQAVARNSSGTLIQNQLVAFKISIIQGSASGTILYQERHTLTTNNYGLANLEIGNGTILFGTQPDWSLGAMYLKVEIDPAGGTSYINMGTSQLLSTPYANYDGDWRISGNDMYSALSGNVGIGTNSTIKGKLDIFQYQGGTAGSLISTLNHQLVLGGPYGQNANDNGVKLWVGDYDNDGSTVYPLYIEDENNKVDFWIKNRANQTTALPTMFFDGRFGIGTTAPTNSRIHIEGANSFDATIRLNNTGTNGTDFFMASTSDTWNAGGKKFVMGHGVPSSSTINMVLNDNGELGLGTTDPLGRLSIESSSGNAPVMSFQKGLVVKDGTSNTGNDFEIQNSDGSVKFMVADNSNVGIGTDSPEAGLHVKGSSAPDSYLYIQSDDSEDAGIKLYEGTTPKWTIYNDASANGFRISSFAYGVSSPFFLKYSNGYVGIGTNSPTSRLDVRGNVTIRDESTGDIVVELGTGLDYAEGFNVSENNDVLPGTVLCIDPENPGKLRISTQSYDTKVAGIVAGANELGSGIVLGKDLHDCNVALAGRVYCNVDATNESIQAGDLLTTSAIPGFAMKASDYEKSKGAILGKAMEPLRLGEKGKVLVLVTLQ